LRVREFALDRHGVERRHGDEFGVAAVALAAEIAGLGPVRRVLRVAQPGIDQDPLAEARRGHAGAEGDDAAGHIGALNARKARAWLAQGGIVLSRRRKSSHAAAAGRLGHRAAVPGGAGVDVGVVHAAGADPNQRLAGRGPGQRHVVAKLQLVEPAVAGQHHGAHALGQGHGRIRPRSGQPDSASISARTLRAMRKLSTPAGTPQ
jgi:hypothetical protein